MNFVHTIYVALCVVTDKLYFGVTSKSLEKRKRQHIATAARKPRFRFHLALRKHGATNFVWYVIGTVPNARDASDVETVFIRYFRTTDYSRGYNSTAGGEGTRILSEASRRKLSVSLSGREFSEEHRQKLKAARNNRTPATQETRDKMRAARLGKPMGFSGEALAKISAANKGKKHPGRGIGVKRPYVHSPRRGSPRSEETRLKISASLKGRVKSAITCQKIGASKKGQPNPKNSVALKGRPKSEETRRKMSVAKKMKMKKEPVYAAI